MGFPLMVIIAIGLAGLATIISLLVLLKVLRRPTRIHDALPVGAAAMPGQSNG